jgi:hypothetical protein
LSISPRFRIFLAAKGLLLAGIAALFFAVVWWTAWDPTRAWLTRAGVGVAFALLSAFLAWAACLAFADAVVGQAEQRRGAVALPSRRSGYSLRLPDGRYVEFILHNPWGPLGSGRAYTVTFGRFSRVLVAPPEPDPPGVP